MNSLYKFSIGNSSDATTILHFNTNQSVIQYSKIVLTTIRAPPFTHKNDTLISEIMIPFRIIQSPEVPKGTFRECKRSPRSRASPDFGLSPLQKAQNPFQRLCAFLIHPHTIFDYPVLIFLCIALCSFSSSENNNCGSYQHERPEHDRCLIACLNCLTFL